MSNTNQQRPAEGFAQPAGSPIFARFARVRHVKTGGIYVIGMVPNPAYRLEATNKPFYAYYREDLPAGERVYWFRSQAEMEDGRFCLENDEVSDRRAHGNENTTGANGGSLH